MLMRHGDESVAGEFVGVNTRALKTSIYPFYYFRERVKL